MTMTDESVAIDTERLAELRRRVSQNCFEQIAASAARDEADARLRTLRDERQDLEGEYAIVSGYRDVLRGEV